MQAGQQSPREFAAMAAVSTPAAQTEARAATPNSSATQQATTLQAPAAGAPAAQNSAPAILVPFQLPQMAQPVMLRVQQEDEDGADDGSGGAAAKRTWTVTLSLDAGALGLVHVGIGLRDGSVSVRLSAGTAEGAAQLSTWLPELKASLEQADFTPGELLAAQAQPAKASGRSQAYEV